MTKTELINKISDISSQVDDIIYAINNKIDDLRSLRRELDNLPQEEDEIDDSKKEEED